VSTCEAGDADVGLIMPVSIPGSPSYLVHTGSDDGDALLALADLAPELLPFSVSAHLRSVWTLEGDEELRSQRRSKGYF
jgi:hypothetical protein